jgi:hypothetical protein
VSIVSEPERHGPPLEQVTAIFAAEQDGFTVEEALEIEGVALEDWLNARASLLEELAVDPELHERYTAALAEAQARLHRDVSPLFDSVEAWVALLKSAEGTSPARFLSQHGLTVGDVARLERHWRRSLAADSGLRATAKSLRESADAPPLPALRFGERRLVPSRFAPTAESNAASTPRSASITASLQAVDPLELDRVAARVARGDEGDPSTDRTLLGQVDADPVLAAHFNRRVEHFRRTRKHEGRLPRVKQVRGGPPKDAATASPPLGYGPPPTSSSVEDTAELASLNLALAPLPFRVSEPRSDSNRSEHETASDEPDADRGVTSASAAASVDATGFVDAVILAQPVLPFRDAASTAPASVGASQQDESQPPAGSGGIDSTGEVDAIRIASGATPWEGSMDVPTLTLAQYASYCAELSLFGALHAQTITRRYGIQSLDVHERLGAVWSERFRDDADLRQRYASLFAQYRDWLLQHAHKTKER